MNATQLSDFLLQNKCCFCDKVSVRHNILHSNDITRIFNCQNCLVSFRLFYFNGAYLKSPPTAYNIHYKDIIIEYMTNHHREKDLVIYIGNTNIHLPFVNFSTPNQAKQLFNKIEIYSLYQ